MIMDDQCAILNVRGEGLVIITGYGHAGIINTVRNAQAISGTQAIYAVIGGFHLSGPAFEPVISRTIMDTASVDITFSVAHLGKTY